MITAPGKPRHAAPLSTRYMPELVTFSRHRKPNRRPLSWHADNLAAAAVLAIGERAIRGRHARRYL